MGETKKVNCRVLSISLLVWLIVTFSLQKHAIPASSSSQKTTQRTVNFVQDIQPIFNTSCVRCHGSSVQMGQLRLDSRNLALRGGISGKAIIPGKSGESLLVQRIQGLGDKVRMPLEGDPLSVEQTALIRAWIDQGAVWPEQASVSGAEIDKHWAYVKPVRPSPPSQGHAKGSWVRNPIDDFVLARLEKEGLTPSPEASRETLIRRVSLDLTGLPPSIEEIEAFLTDKSPDAYEKVLDRLFGSPHYGERWARHWLDLARYADTNGYEKDTRRMMWKYRDWVVNALNQDMPFNRFTVEQIAGDMLPNATLDQRIATGFNRNTMNNEEDGVDKEESRWTILLDRVGTTATVWLGTTLACAQCHNHKYDPFTQREFYQFLAFFDNTEYKLDGVGTSHVSLVEPLLELPTPEQETRRKSLKEEIASLEEKLKTQTPELDEAQERWEREEAVKQTPWRILEPAEFTFTGSAYFVPAEDKSLLVTTWSEKINYSIVVRTSLRGITAFQLEVFPDKSLPALGPGRSTDGNFILTSFKIEKLGSTDPNRTERIGLINAQSDFSQPGFPIAAVLDESVETGWAVAPKVGQPHTALFQTASPIGEESGTTLIFTLEHQSSVDHAAIGRFRLSATNVLSPKPAPPLPAEIRQILSLSGEGRNNEQRNQLSAYYRSITPLLQPARDRLMRLAKELEEMPIVTTLVMQERPLSERPSTHLRIRGAYLNKGEQVYAGVPVVLHSLPENQLPNRLGLAHWLVDENNPLVGRVTVNRLWEQIFGRGIVETAEDFGLKGERPTHPELLDWLATEFVRQGWSMKAILRNIVTSATYRQSSQVSPALLERDPDNRLLARGPRFRLEAEMIRDLALAAGGLLNRRVGGPSVFPYQPEGIWSLPYNPDQWVNSAGADGFRRGLYTFWRRSAPYPSFVSFDATSREFCTVRRVRTNTPLQALTALNDPAFFEAARGLARRIVAEAASDDRSRAVHGYRLCTARRPKAAEIDSLTELYHQELKRFGQDVPAAQKLTGSQDLSTDAVTLPELAAWTVVSNVLLNMDQTLTKE